MTWKDKINVVNCQDCLELMSKMEDNCVDLVLTDPPYGMSYLSSRRKDKHIKIENDENIDWFKDFIKECYRILKDDSHIYIFCNDYAISYFRKFAKDVGFNPKRALVWVKNNHTSGDLTGDYANKTEFIFFAHKGRKELNGSRDTNIVKGKKALSNIHPTEKPVDLMYYFIQKSSKENDLVFDPFMGSWTTAVASQNLGRNFIGAELSEEYCEIGRQRLRQLTLI